MASNEEGGEDVVSDIEDLEGWCYEYKLQDYTLVKHISSQF